MANSLIMVAVVLGLWLSGSATTTRGMLARVNLWCYQYCCVSGLVTYQLVSMKCLWEIPVTLIAFSLILSHCLFAAAITDRVFRLGTNFTLTCIDDGNNGNHALSVSFIVDGHNIGTNTVKTDLMHTVFANYILQYQWRNLKRRRPKKTIMKSQIRLHVHTLWGLFSDVLISFQFSNSLVLC